mgnify:FL=1
MNAGMIWILDSCFRIPGRTGNHDRLPAVYEAAMTRRLLITFENHGSGVEAMIVARQ